MKKLILGIALAAMALTVHGRATARTELVGHVISPLGKSIKATAVLCYWQTKPGRQPSDMRDLPRHVQADEQGDFKFESLDPSLLYQVLIFAPGWRQQSIKNVDPASGPLNVRLEPAIPTNAPVKLGVPGAAASSERMLASSGPGNQRQSAPSRRYAKWSRSKSTSTRRCTGFPAGIGNGALKTSD